MLELESKIVYPMGYKVHHCPACGIRYNGKPHERKTNHHILPQRLFGKNNKYGLLEICQNCHCDLEREIPERVLLSPSEYVAIVNSFLDYKCLERTF